MAEYIMKELVKREGVAGDWEIESAAVSREEIGNPVYPPARRKLLEQGIPCGHHAARQMTRADYDRFDLLIGMDRSNPAHHAAAFAAAIRTESCICCWFYRPKRRGGRRPMVYRRF